MVSLLDIEFYHDLIIAFHILVNRNLALCVLQRCCEPVLARILFSSNGPTQTDHVTGFKGKFQMIFPFADSETKPAVRRSTNGACLLKYFQFLCMKYLSGIIALAFGCRCVLGVEFGANAVATTTPEPKASHHRLVGWLTFGLAYDDTPKYVFPALTLTCSMIGATMYPGTTIPHTTSAQTTSHSRTISLLQVIAGFLETSRTSLSISNRSKFSVIELSDY